MMTAQLPSGTPSGRTLWSVEERAGQADPAALSAEERRLTVQVLDSEYRLLMSALSAVWSASLVRTTIFLGVLSAAGVALGFAAQGGIGGPAFSALALAVLPLLIFLGVATFVRLVQLQRESVVYITGMNRIRHFFQLSAPHGKPYFVLEPFDDVQAVYRGMGTGMARRPVRFRLLHLIVQTQGIVGVVTGAVAAAFGWLASTPVAGSALGWLVAAAAFVATITGLFAYWQRSLDELSDGMRPINPGSGNVDR
jgi:hypothetical protein